MSERARLLHNMSAPPKTTVRYAGLSGLASDNVGDSGVSRMRYGNDGVFGAYVAFCMPEAWQAIPAASILEALGVDGEPIGPSPEATLTGLIERRAGELPIAGGCLVKPFGEAHPRPWPDPLAALAVITKSSANVWLRAKTPNLSAREGRFALSLLLPPSFADRICEASR